MASKEAVETVEDAISAKVHMTEWRDDAGDATWAPILTLSSCSSSWGKDE